MKLKTARLRAGLTQAELAQHLGITQPNISGYESGATVPRPSIRHKIDELLGATCTYPNERPLSVNEANRALEAIQLVTPRLGFYKAIKIFSDKTNDEIRELTDVALSAGLRTA